MQPAERQVTNEGAVLALARSIRREASRGPDFMKGWRQCVDQAIGELDLEPEDVPSTVFRLKHDPQYRSH